MEATPHSEEEDRKHTPKFKWGESGGDGGTENEVQFYKSFTYDGVDYSLYDSVYLCAKGEPQPYIGKLVKIWELQDHRKYIRVLWYFRPVEILNWLKDDAPLDNEIFLACGNGKGLLDDNFLELLVGKCNVVCTAKDSRNPQPSDAEVRMADYVFYRTFDVGKYEISDRFEDTIAGTEVRHFFNVKRHAIISDPQPGVNRNDNWKTDSYFKLDFPEAVATLAKNAKPGVQTSPSVKESKRSIVSALYKGHISDEGRQKSVQDSLHLEASDCRPFKGMKVTDESARPLEKLESNVSPTLARKESYTNILQKPRVGLKESAEKPPGSSLRTSPYEAKSEARKELVARVMLSIVNTSDKATKLPIKADFKFAEECSKLESNVSPTLARKESYTNISQKPRVGLKESAEKPPGSSLRTSPYKAKSEASKELVGKTMESNVSPTLARKESYRNISQKPRVGLKESAEKPPGSSLRTSPYKAKSEARKELVRQTLESNVSPTLARKESYTNILQKPRVGLKESAEKPPGSSLRTSPYEAKSEAIKELVRPTLESNVSPTLARKESYTNILQKPRVGLKESAEKPPGSSLRTSPYKAKNEARKELVRPTMESNVSPTLARKESYTNISQKPRVGLKESAEKPPGSSLRTPYEAKSEAIKELVGQKLESNVSPTLARKECYTNISQKPRVGLKESAEKHPGSSLRTSPYEAKSEARKELVRPTLESNVSPTLARKESYTNILQKPRVGLKESAEKPPGSSLRTSPYEAKSEAIKELVQPTLESNVSPTLARKESYTNILQKPRVGLKESAEKPPGSSLRISPYEAKSEARKELVGQDRSKWFKPLPWEDAMQRGHEKGTLVLLRNLDPCYTSAEVEDLVLHAFKERCTAKMMQRNAFSSPHYGEAYVIFKTREAAEMAITKLESGCLMLPNGRPLVACKQAPTETGRPPRFAGHLSIDNFKHQVERQEKRDAVSTSHFSQGNTIEYDLALEWCSLQQRSEHWWKALHEKHEVEISRIKLQLKNP